MTMPSQPKKRILIADDDKFLTSMFALSLQTEDRDITIAHDGSEVIELTKTAPKFDLVILDLLMPKVDGYHVLEYFRDNNYSCPVIMLSNVQNEEEQKKCIDCGAKDFYNKNTTDLDGLVSKVKKYV